MDKMKKQNGIYLMKFNDNSKLVMAGYPYDFRRYNVKNTNKFLKHFNLTNKKIAKTRQKHTKNIVINPQPGEYVNVDGFVTDQNPVMIVTADCIPVLIKNNNTNRAALLHAGWKGVKKRIHIETLKHLGNKKDLEVYLLPSIQKKSFQVGEDFVKEFATRKEFKKYLTKDIEKGKYKFDLQKFLKKELKNVGLNPNKIHINPHDTYTSNTFHSYRREGKENYGLNAIIYIP